MLWVFHLKDKPNSKPIRAEHQAAHSAYLKKVDPVCFFTGPLQSDDAAENIGSLWIISANSRAEAMQFLENEAFFKAGVFESWTLNRVRKGHFHPELAA